MHTRIALVVLALALLSGVSGTARVAADGPYVGYPHSMASLGDSITRAYDSDAFGDRPENSWSTGTNASVNSIYSRLLAVAPPISGNRFNDAVIGATMSALNGQAQTAVGQGAELVIILMGANDICTSTEANMTPVATFQAQFQQAMQTLSTGLPNARILVASIPDVYNLWVTLHSNSSARFIWGLASICQSLLANPNSVAAADVQRRANVRQRNIDDNTVLHDVCATYVHCKFDNYTGFNTQFTSADVSTIDYFHPSLAGQAVAAQQEWTNSYDFSDLTPPVSGSSGAEAGAGAMITLSATDAGGVSGIEYSVGAGSYQRYTAPFALTEGTAFTWRAVDLSGNTEATHTCVAQRWTWSAGDSDCDGFSDATEAFTVTATTVACAATSAPNDEGGTDAWPIDFDDNQRVTILDVSYFSSTYGSHGPGPPYVVRQDFNGDDRITILDISYFSSLYGKRCGA